MLGDRPKRLKRKRYLDRLDREELADNLLKKCE